MTALRRPRLRPGETPMTAAQYLRWLRKPPSTSIKPLTEEQIAQMVARVGNSNKPTS